MESASSILKYELVDFSGLNKTFFLKNFVLSPRRLETKTVMSRTTSVLGLATVCSVFRSLYKPTCDSEENK